MDPTLTLGSLGWLGPAPLAGAAAVTVLGWTLYSINAGRKATRWYRRKRILALLTLLTAGFAALTFLGLSG